MKSICLDEKWTLRRGFLDSLGAINATPGTEVNLPNDAMISTPVSPDARPGNDSGYYKGDYCNYTKYVNIPKEWEGDTVGLYFDGVMMNAVIEVNGCKAGSHHYGYAPFYVDLTNLVTYGEDNRITVSVDTSAQPNSRWYTGTGLYRGVKLLRSPRVHIVPDGIYIHTKSVEEGFAFIEAEAEIANETDKNRLVRVEFSFVKESDYQAGKTDLVAAKVSRTFQVNAFSKETGRLAVNIKDPVLWSTDDPNLYHVTAKAVDTGTFTTHFNEGKVQPEDEAEILFGIKTVTVDSVRGLRVNGCSVKLKGGCIHHDNGLLGSVSLYETEARKVKRLKEIGFNAIRTAHNPPSAALVEACDRLGMYIFDEAFDHWGIAKRVGDYSRFFDKDWEEDLTAYVKRDRTHPSVIMWSIGNEIPERGGLNGGYALAKKLADKVRNLDSTRPISNGICSYWAGLDDIRSEGKSNEQNANTDTELQWEMWSEPFSNGLDVFGYNYMEVLYERDHANYPERVILGSENFPQEIGFRWPGVEKNPHIIGDFTWTAWDYLGEAGIGKAYYLDEGDPLLEKGPWGIMPPATSPYPWRLANDADIDITGHRLAQGAYRSVVWGSKETFLYTYHPDKFGKHELMTMWGFPEVEARWNYEGCEGKPVELMIFSSADEVEVILNGKSLGRKAVSTERPMPKSVRFEAVYEPGKIEAVSFKDGKEVSRAALETAGKMTSLRLVPEKTELSTNGHDVTYVSVEVIDEQGRLVPDAEVKLTAELSGTGAELSAFGTARPITEEIYTDSETLTYRGLAMAVIRSGYEQGEATLTVTGNIDGKPVKSEIRLQIR